MTFVYRNISGHSKPTSSLRVPLPSPFTVVFELSQWNTCALLPENSFFLWVWICFGYSAASKQGPRLFIAPHHCSLHRLGHVHQKVLDAPIVAVCWLIKQLLIRKFAAAFHAYLLICLRPACTCTAEAPCWSRQTGREEVADWRKYNAREELNSVEAAT